MPRKAAKHCTTPGCGGTTTTGGKCSDCTNRVQADSDQRRGTSTQRGYDREHRERFRTRVLDREPTCRLCSAPSTVADHWPRSRRELIELGLDPNDPAYGRGLCKRCHDSETARNQPGGWHRPSRPH